MKRYYIFFALLVILVGVVVATQTTQSSGYKGDQNKQSDLQKLSGDIENAASLKHKLPDSLAQVQAKDLQGKLADYTYTKLGYNTYQLCTTFAHERKPPASQKTYLSNDNYTDTTYHAAGHVCFTFTAYGVQPPTPSPLLTTPVTHPTVNGTTVNNSKR